MKEAPKYIDKKIEPPNSEEEQERVDALINRIETPLFQPEYKDSGEISFEKDGLAFSFAYSSLPQHLLNLDIKDFRKLKKDEYKLVGAMNFKPENFRRVETFLVTTPNETLDVFKATLPNTNIYINTNMGKLNSLQPAFFYSPINSVILNINPFSIGAIVVLFHEIGHQHDPSERRDIVFIPKHPGDNVRETDEYLTVKLESERNAWAFALKKLKHILPALNLTESELNDIIHKFALHSYSKETREIREKRG